MRFSPPGTAANAVPLPVLIATFCVLWSAAFAVAKAALADCPPLLLLVARFLASGAIVVAAAMLLATQRLSRRDVLIFSVLGIANNALYLGLNYVGMRGVSAGLSALIVSANPVATVALAALFLNERITWRKAAGLILGVGGVAFIVKTRMASGGESALGVALAFGALFSLVAGTILFKKLAPSGSLWLGSGVQSLSGGLALAPFAFAFESASDILPSWRLLLALAYLVLLASGLAFFIWFHLIKAAGATAASAYHFLMPPLGLFFGWLLLGERVSAFDFAGVVPIALGIYLVTRPAQSAREMCRLEEA